MNWKLSVILLILSVIACGAPVRNSTLSAKSDVSPIAESVTKDTHIITDMSTDVNMEVCRVDAEIGGLRVRPAPGDLSTYSKVLANGDSALVRNPTVTEDMGLWYELVDGGWINARYLCEEE